MIATAPNCLVFSALWCIAQVTILSSFALLFTSCVASSVRQKSRFLNATMVVIAMVTVAAFVPSLPAHIDEMPAPSNAVIKPENANHPATFETAPRDAQEGGVNLLSAWNALSRSIVLDSRIGSRLTRIGSQFRINYGTGTTICAGTLLLVGGLRILFSICFLWRVRRTGAPIVNVEIANELETLKLRLGCERHILLIESTLVQNAAIIGGWPHTLVLPANWHDWTEGERQAVLAHELAHVVRHDPLWRLLFALVTAIHFYNPLVHLLFRRSALQQEVAADRRAATAIGRRRYLQALLQLAIRQDDLLRTSTGSGFLAVHSEFLFRRIKMLRTREGRSSAKKHKFVGRFASVTSLSILAIFAVGSLAIKSVAQEKQVTSEDGGVEKASFEDRKPGHALPGPFSREPVGYIEPQSNDSGMFVFRVGDFLKSEGMDFIVPIVNSALNSNWKEVFPDAPSPEIDIRDIAHITGISMLTVGHNLINADESNRMSFGFGFGTLEISLHQPVDFDAFMKKVPGVGEVSRNGHSWYRMTIPALTPNPVHVRAAGNKILIDLFTKHAFDDSKANGDSGHSPALLNAIWQREDNGIFTGIASKKHFSGLILGESEFCQAARRVVEQVSCFGLSCDFTAANELEYRFLFECDSMEAARELKNLITQMQEMPMAGEHYPYGIRPLKEAVTTVRENPNGSGSVIMTSSMSDPLKFVQESLK